VNWSWMSSACHCVPRFTCSSFRLVRGIVWHSACEELLYNITFFLVLTVSSLLLEVFASLGC
jgi:hypothetical protein